MKNLIIFFVTKAFFAFVIYLFITYSLRDRRYLIVWTLISKNDRKY